MRLGIGRHRDDGGEADPDVTVETPDLLTRGQMDYQVLIVDNQLGHRVEDTRAGYWIPARTDVMRCVLKPSQCIRPT